MSEKSIVIVGAGFAGVSATKKLAKHYKKNPDVKITLIDRHSYHTYMTELHEVAGGRVEPQAIQYDLQRLFCRKKNVQLVTDNVTTIDHKGKKVITEHGEYAYDYVILGMGGEPNDFGTPGVKEHGFTLWSMSDAIRLREHIESTVQNAALVRDEAVRKAMLTFVVCGSGFTGVEMFGELIDWKARLAQDNKIDPEEISLILVEAAPTILNMLDRNDAAKAERYIDKKGGKILKNAPIVKVNAESIELKDGTIIPTHSLIWTAGVQANSQGKEMGFEAGRAGRLIANEFMEAKGFENTYIAGDQVYFEETAGKPTPQIVQAAEQTAHTAAATIIANIDGTEKIPFKSNYQGFMVSIGARYGVACLFDKIHLSGFWAMLMKHMVNMLYYIQIHSGYYLFQYIMHEFFHIKDGRNIFRGHLSRYGNVLWSVPLRLFYGATWLVECWKKVQGEGSWFNDTIRLPFEWLQKTTEASSGASQAAETTETVLKPIFGLSYAYGEDPMMVFDKMPHWFESIMRVMIPNTQVALFLQKTMTVVEILVALAILGGLFTWLANAATIALVATFCLSGMFYWANMWFVFAAIALMNGSGRAFGLDYWAVPWIQRTLGKWWYKTPRSLYGTETASK